ncbi:MAG TPA: CHAT domain-containing protein, partial [Thermoanaerobaculia bacterium]|nr:CHAT domain-containing protein [Thermoanaerobaculia bacterium]
RLDEALAGYRAAAPGLERSDPEGAATARNNACAILNDRGDYRAALAECREALRLRRGLADPVALARTLNNLGLARQSLGRTAEAEAAFREALALNRRAGDAEGEGINLANLGVAAIDAGRYGRALSAYREAEALARAHAAEPWAADQARISRINEGVVLEKLGAYEEALDLYRGLLAAGPALGPHLRASLIANAGTLDRNLGDPRRAIAAYEEAAAIYSRLGDRAGLSNARLNLGIARHLNLGDRRSAEADYRAALAGARAAGDRSEEIQDLFYLGRLLLEERRLPEAEQAFRDCLAAAEASGSAEGRVAAHEGLGRIFAARGDVRGALASLEQAMGEIEHTRAEIGSRRFQASYFGDRRAVYAAAVELLARQAARGVAGAAERALEITERAKVRELVDALGAPATGATPATGAPARSADLARWARAGGAPILDYFLGEKDLFLWRIDPSGIRLFDLGPAEPVLSAVRRLHRELAAGRAPAESELAALARALIAPLGPMNGISRLRIAPDGALRYLPFELLPGADGVALVERVAIRYEPSATAALALSRRGRSGVPDRAFLGFGSPRLPAPGPAPTPAGLLAARFALGPLPGAAGEIAASAGRLPGSRASFLGARATEAAFRREAAQGARVLHFATHAVFDERAGRGAAILLTPAGDDDGLLEPAEIAGLAVPAGSAEHSARIGLAVLSACSTALGPDPRGGGALASLTGAFLAAGASGVVASLWDVGDRATAVFMDQFYAQLGRGLPPDEALAAAKRRLRATPGWNRPEAWAAFVLIGEPPPVAPRHLGFGLGLGALLAGLAALGGLALRAVAGRRRASNLSLDPP